MRPTSILLAALALLAQPGPSELNRIKVGQPAPDFTALTIEGRPARLAQYHGKNIVLVFYRGQW